jgi:DNA mismatch repair protein MutL
MSENARKAEVRKAGAQGGGRIRVLPPEVIAQIAAGEVVERPFSVIKELVENSLDAGATSLRVELKDGGLTSIRVTDDGRGFAREDLALAFVSHATSKLSQLADLDHVASLGFRGEALASIGSVSRCRIRSRPRGSDEGAEIRCEGGTISEIRPCGTPPGSVIEVRDLFYNTPARRRFLKSARAEKARVQDLLVRVALPRLDVDVTLVSEDKVVLHLPAGEDLEARVVRAFGRTYAGGLWPVGPLERGSYRIEGLIAEPERSRRDSALELAWVNGRAARDKSSLFAVREAFRGHLLHGRYPVTFLMLDVPPDMVDVNVHPTKVEVRFAEQRAVAGLMHEAVANALHLRGRRGLGRGGAIAGGSALDAGGEQAAEGPGDAPARPADARGIPPGRPVRPRPRAGFPQASLFAAPGVSPVGADAASAPRSSVRPEATASPAEGEALERRDSVGAVREEAEPRVAHPFAGLDVAGGLEFLQVHDLYLVVPTRDGLALIDQHALHERVVYERLKRRHDEGGKVEIQRLLVPAVVELPAPDKHWLLEAADELAAEGLLLDDFGGNAIVVRGVPAALGRRADPERLVFAMLDGSERPSARAEVLERFHSMACRSSVMSGDRLDESEVRALLAEATGLEHPHNCPHGRPTVLNLDTDELERWFRRRV